MKKDEYQSFNLQISVVSKVKPVSTAKTLGGSGKGKVPLRFPCDPDLN